MSVDVVAARTFFFVLQEAFILSQNDTHLENHFWPYRHSKIRGIDSLGIFRVDYFVVAPIHVAIAKAISTIALNDTVKSLISGDMSSNHFMGMRTNTCFPSRTKLGRHWYIPPQVIHHEYLVYLNVAE